jgi:hypothetical protein
MILEQPEGIPLYLEEFTKLFPAADEEMADTGEPERPVGLAARQAAVFFSP